MVSFLSELLENKLQVYCLLSFSRSYLVFWKRRFIQMLKQNAHPSIRHKRRSIRLIYRHHHDQYPFILIHTLA